MHSGWKAQICLYTCKCTHTHTRASTLQNTPDAQTLTLLLVHIPSHQNRGRYTSTHTECVIGSYQSITASHWPAVSWLTEQFKFGPSSDCGATEVKLYYNSLSNHDPSAQHPACTLSTRVQIRMSVHIKTDCSNVAYKIPESVALYVAASLTPLLSAKHVRAVVALFNDTSGSHGWEEQEKTKSVLSDLILSTPLSEGVACMF